MNNRNRNNLSLLAKVITICLVLSVFVFYLCDLIKYVEADRQETIKKFKGNKCYMEHLAFEGQIIEKRYCAKCEINKYTLRIRLSSISEKRDFFLKISFYYYYEINKDSTMSICVSKDLFTRVSEKQLISKESDSNYIKTSQFKLLYLSEKENLWIPEN